MASRSVLGLALLAAMPAAAQDLPFTEILDRIDGRWAPLHAPCANAAFEIRLSPDRRRAEFGGWPAPGTTTSYRVNSAVSMYSGRAMTQPVIILLGAGVAPQLLRMPKPDMISISSVLKQDEPAAIFVRCVADQ
jgi:hypothetical protein